MFLTYNNPVYDYVKSVDQEATAPVHHPLIIVGAGPVGMAGAIDAAMRASDNQLIAANATGCLEVFSTPYPETSWQIPWIHSLFGNTAALFMNSWFGHGITCIFGLGALLARLEALKAQLRERGWFDRKRPLPAWPARGGAPAGPPRCS